MRMRAAAAPRSPVASAGEMVLPGYRVVSLLSHGRRIDTYDVESLDRDCRCVVKILRPDRRHEQEVAEAVLLEGRLLCELTHPHLVRGYEVHTDPGPAMVLQTLGGATLGALIDDDPIGVEDSAVLGLQLVSVLSYLHRTGWLHLDVKPANVVVDAGRAVLIDLSLVGRPGDGRRGAGTRGYLAPEQALGRDLSAATDVWGLGVTLLESLTGDLPYGDEATWHSTRRPRLLRRRPPRPPGPLSWLPAGYDATLRTCLDPDPANRPTLADLRRCLEQFAPDDHEPANTRAH